MQLAAVFLELVQRVGNVGQQLRRHRRQRFGQRVGKVAFVGLLRQLRLAQLDQRVHQRRIAHGAELEQALVDRAAVRGRGVEHLAVVLQCVLQPLSGENVARRTRQPGDSGGRTRE